MVSSDKQVAIYNTWENTDKNILIQAVAGSGKTTTLMGLLKLCKHRTLYLAFNKSIKEETEQKMLDQGLKQGKALTLHALGLTAIRSIHKKIEIDSNKNYKLFNIIKKQHHQIIDELPYEDKMRLMFTLMDMNDVSRLYLENDKDKIIDIMLVMDKNTISNEEIGSYFNVKSKTDYIGELWADLLKLREESYTKEHIEIDFIDMIYLPASKNYPIPIHPYYLMIDEAQDLNLCQHKLIDNLIAQGTIRKWIAVGDRNQSIYGFSGAYASSFDLFKSKDNVVELPLDICYRCPVDVVNSANEVYNVMIANKKHTGVVKHLNGVESLYHLKTKPKAMIICRNKGPLIDLYFELVTKSIPCYLVGDDILNSIVRFSKPYKFMKISKALSTMEFESFKLEKTLKTEEDKMRLHIFKENYLNFKKLSSNLCSDSDKVETLLEKVKKLFENRQNAVTLCTIHKSKGLEADYVYILNENLIPSKFAKSPEQLVQENNLKYVARTRAREEMYFLNIKFGESLQTVENDWEN